MKDESTPQGKVLNTAKQIRTDVEVTGQPADEKRLAKVLSNSLKVIGQSTYTKGKR